MLFLFLPSSSTYPGHSDAGVYLAGADGGDVINSLQLELIWLLLYGRAEVGRGVMQHILQDMSGHRKEELL